MKKSVLFGVLAFFAVSAMSVQNVEAQKPVKKSTTTEKKVEKKAEAAATADTKAVKKDDCCANKTVTTDKKSDDCCANKQADAGEKKFNVEKKEREAKSVSVDDKKPARQKDEKTRRANAGKTEK